MAAPAAIAKGGRGLSGPAFDGAQRLHCVGAGDGRVYQEEEGALVAIGDTGGCPSHIAFDHLNSLFVADAAHGAILVLKDDGSQQIVVSEYEGKALKVRRV